MQTFLGGRSAIAPSERQKKYGWAVAGFVLVGGFGTVMGILQSRSSDDRYSPSDQSLDSLDALPLADRAGGIDVPGGPLGKDSRRRNASWTSPESMLFQAPAGEGATAAAPAEGADAAGDKLMQDMAKASAVGKKPGDPSGWNGESARTGLQAAAAARPNLVPMSNSLGGSGGGSSASASSGAVPFGVGQSHPGEHSITRLPSAERTEPNAGGYKGIAALRKVAAAAGNARNSLDAERMWGHTAGAFDGSSALGTMSGGGGSDSGVGTGGGVPGNLKDFGGANPSDLSKKEIQPPAPPPPKPVDNTTMQKQQMMMMAAMVGVGLLGAVMQGWNSAKPSGSQTTDASQASTFYQYGNGTTSGSRPPTGGRVGS